MSCIARFFLGQRPATWTLAATLLAAGCGRDEPKAYRVPKESPPAHPQTALPPGHPDIGGGGDALPRITWTAPAGWQEGRRSALRAASFTITGADGASADVAVIPMPPAGSELDLVNMWRQQMQLGATTAAEAEKAAETATVGGQPGKLFEFASEAPLGESGKRGRILVAILNRDGLNWYFKMAGEDSLVREQKANFLAFLKSVQFPPADAPVAAGESPSPAAAASTPAHDAGKPHWTVPEGWQETAPGQFLVAKFNVPGEGAPTAVNISRSDGEGGGWLANVNRWRQQMGLAPAGEGELASLTTAPEVAGGRASQVDLSGTDARTAQPTRTIAVMVQRPGEAWFYRLVGDPKTVEREKDAFLKFVRTVDYSHDH